MSMKRAAVSLVRRGGKYLAVWSQSLKGWTLPGGKIEPGETLFGANARELREETGLEVLRQKLVYQAPSSLDAAVQVSVMEVLAAGEPREAEKGSPVTWLTEQELVGQSPYREFYARMFLTLTR